MFDFEEDEDYGSSSNVYFQPGLEASPVDPYLIQPRSSWRGQRTIRHRFGAEQDDLYGDIEDYGRLYRAQRGHYNVPAHPADSGAIIAKSGHSGMRGARDQFFDLSPGEVAGPRHGYTGEGFGADRRMSVGGPGGIFSYEGGPEAAFLAFTALAIVGRANKLI